MKETDWIHDGHCDGCGEYEVDVKAILTTIVPIYLCKNCLSESWEVYLGSEGA